MTIRVLNYDLDCEVIPHAILWRSLRYCTQAIREGEDDLDRYAVASFVIGNEIRFELRVYSGHIHPEVTVTLYLPEDIQDEEQVLGSVVKIVQEMAIPDSAIAWRRGQKFEFGKLRRSPKDRLLESEARTLVLKIAASQPNRTTSIGKLREEIPKYFDLSSTDKRQSASRKNEALWHTVLRNTVSSHTDGPRTIFSRGWAKKTPDGIKVTKKGMDYLNSIGFSTGAK